jgi:hypothetical protein
MASSWVSRGPPGTRSRHVRPRSIVDTSAPASIATQSRSGSSGWHAIPRTWWVSGGGGKDHSDEDDSVSKPLVCSQEFPASAERHTLLGSVPAQTTSRFAGLAATAIISRPASPIGCQDLPP